MKRILTLILAGALASAGLYADRPARRERKQQKRIGEGVENGSLTAKETAKLEKREARLHREIKRDRADGPGLTPKERAKIEKQQDKLSRDIYREKHDKQTQK